jgi:hypothetical protein
MMTTSESRFECPTCQEPIPVQLGGWPFLYSQAFLHLRQCGVEPIECDRVAGQIADRIYREGASDATRKP